MTGFYTVYNRRMEWFKLTLVLLMSTLDKFLLYECVPSLVLGGWLEFLFGAAFSFCGGFLSGVGEFTFFIPFKLLFGAKLNATRNHSFSTYAKSSKKTTFLTHWYVRVRIRGYETVVFRKILRTYFALGIAFHAF